MIGNRKGFSYVELLIALTLVCVCAAPVFSSLVAASQNSAYVARHYRAQAAADGLAVAAANDITVDAAWLADFADDGFVYTTASDGFETNFPLVFAMAGQTRLAAVAVCDDDGLVLARAVRMTYHHD